MMIRVLEHSTALDAESALVRRQSMRHLVVFQMSFDNESDRIKRKA
jgi:hypothetical protein